MNSLNEELYPVPPAAGRKNDHGKADPNLVTELPQRAKAKRKEMPVRLTRIMG